MVTSAAVCLTARVGPATRGVRRRSRPVGLDYALDRVQARPHGAEEPTPEEGEQDAERTFLAVVDGEH